MNEDLKAIYDLNKLLEQYNIKWINEDIDTLDDDSEGNRLEFYVYYEEPKLNKQTDLNLIKNLYNKTIKTYRLDELTIKNEELRAKFSNKSKENFLYY